MLAAASIPYTWKLKLKGAVITYFGLWAFLKPPQLFIGEIFANQHNYVFDTIL
jgi:hypothetical protein